MTLKTCCVHTKNNHLWKGDFSKWKTLIVLRPENIFPKWYDSPDWTIQGRENSPALAGGGTDEGNMTSTQERQRRSSPSPLSSCDYENATHWVLRAVRAGWEPYNLTSEPTLINFVCKVASIMSNSVTPCSPPGSSVHGIFQARILEWVALSFFSGSSPPRGWTHISCIAGRFFTAERSLSQGTLQKTPC